MRGNCRLVTLLSMMLNSVGRVLRSIASFFGFAGYNLYLLRGLKRPEWIYRAYSRIPFRKLAFSSPSEVTAEDIALSERLIAAYQKAAYGPSNSQALSTIWSENIRRHYGDLISAAEGKNPQLLAATLSRMFTQSFLCGIATGDLYSHGLRRVGSRIWFLKCLDDIVSLAEYLGVVRTECPEQGVLGYAFKDGLDELAARIEDALVTPISFPEVGAAYGIRVGNSLVTTESPEHIYVALRIGSAVDLYLNGKSASAPEVVEIGAGFGGTAYWLLKLRKMAVSRYTIVDLPLPNIMQGYFLSKVFGPSSVSLYGETGIDGKSESIVTVLPTHAISSLSERGVDLLINENSMPEMPEDAVVAYLSWAKESLKGLFYSYNQEAYSPVNGIPQVLIPAVVKRVGGFKLLSRDYSWLRRGYVEEVYSCGQDQKTSQS